MPLSSALDTPKLAARAPASAPPASAAAGRQGSGESVAALAWAGGAAALMLLSICLARSSDVLLYLWAANGVAVAAWLRSGISRNTDMTFCGLLLGGAVFGEMLGGGGAGQAVAMASANVAEIVLAVFLTRQLAPARSLSSVKDASRLLLATVGLAPLAGGLIAGLTQMIAADVPLLMTLQTWWLGHALGMSVILPLVMSLNRRALLSLRTPFKLLEWVGLIGLVLGLCVLVYLGQSVSIRFLILPLLILIAVRLRVLGICVALCVIAILGMGGVINGTSVLGQMPTPLPERMVMVQMMLLFGCAPMLLMASLLEERDRLARRARAAQERAELATAAKSRLLANVAHEIKSPVAGVIGIGELWGSGQLGPITPQQKEMADMLVRTSRQVETLAHDLLDVARAESGAVKVELRPTDIVGVIEDVRRTTALRPEARALDLQATFGEPNLVAVADSQRITQVIDNLATNAMKYGASGGVIRFVATRIEDRIRIEVTDQGPGLSETKQIELFEPFNRLGLERSTVEGHGIGLALSKRLVELQDGAIGVISAPGEGATFWIELPAA